MTHKQRTMSEVLSAVNIFDTPADIVVVGLGTVTLVPPIRLTPEGKSRWQTALSSKMCIDNPFTFDNPKGGDRLMIWSFLQALIGNVAANSYEKWFVGVSIIAEEI